MEKNNLSGEEWNGEGLKNDAPKQVASGSSTPFKKRTLFNLVLVLLIFFLVFVLYKSIEEPIAFKQELDTRRNAVVEKLLEIRTAQKAYYGIKAEYAADFNSLKKSLSSDTFLIINVKGDPDDPNNPEVTYDTTFIMAADSMASLGLTLDSLEYVPYGEGKLFDIGADTIRSQKTLVNVVEVGTRWKDFMGKYGAERFQKYDKMYKPNAKLKFGDMNKATLSGNWESK